LTESHYIELTTDEGADPNRYVTEIFDRNKVALIVGMSLNDPNLRRLLYLLSRPANKGMGSVYAIVKSASKLGRASDSLFRHNLTTHWSKRGLTPIFVAEYDEIPTMLRNIQFGLPEKQADPPKWISESIQWVEEGLPPGGSCFLDSWQQIAFETLQLLCEQISTLYRVGRTQESLSVELFAPLSMPDAEPRLYLLATSLGKRPPTGLEGRDRALRRNLGISRGNTQGVAGLSFASGLQLEVLNRGPGYNYNFTPAMAREWERDSLWRSILAVPVLDTRDFVPVAVVCVTSNVPDRPFWRRFGHFEADYKLELYKRMRTTAKYLLVDMQREVS
jgi:hypothetical protein